MQELDPFDPNNWTLERRNDICCISLSNRVDCYCILDRIDYDWASQWLWCHSYSRIVTNYHLKEYCGIYARRSIRIEGFTASGKPRYGNLWLHREITRRKCGPASIKYISDHKNGNTLDNRRKNLRWLSLQENAINRVGSNIRQYYMVKIPSVVVY